MGEQHALLAPSFLDSETGCPALPPIGGTNAAAAPATDVDDEDRGSFAAKNTIQNSTTKEEEAPADDLISRQAGFRTELPVFSRNDPLALARLKGSRSARQHHLILILIVSNLERRCL